MSGMPARIREFCRTTGQTVPESKEAVLRCALEGIALKYRWALERIEEMHDRRLDPLYISAAGPRTIACRNSPPMPRIDR